MPRLQYLQDVVLPDGPSSGEGVGSPTVVPGAASIELAPGVPTAGAVGSPNLIVSSVSVRLTGMPSTETLGKPAIQPGSVTVSASGVSPAVAVGVPKVQAGPATVRPIGVTSSESVSHPALQPGPVGVEPLGVDASHGWLIPDHGDASPAVGASPFDSVTLDYVAGTTALIYVAAQPMVSGADFSVSLSSTGDQPCQLVTYAGSAATIYRLYVFSYQSETSETVTFTAAMADASPRYWLVTADTYEGVEDIQPLSSVATTGVSLSDTVEVDSPVRAVNVTSWFGSLGTWSGYSGVDDVRTDFTGGAGTEIASGDTDSTTLSGPMSISASATHSSARWVSITLGLRGSSAPAVGEPAVVQGLATVWPTGVPSSEIVGQPEVAPGPASVLLTGSSSAAQFGQPELVTGDVSVTLSGVASAEAVGLPKVVSATSAVDVFMSLYNPSTSGIDVVQWDEATDSRTTVVNNGMAYGVSLDAAGLVYWCDTGTSELMCFDGDDQSVVATGVSAASVTIDASDHIYWCDLQANQIVCLDGGTQSVIATGAAAYAVAVDSVGRVYWVDTSTSQVMCLDGGTQSALANDGAVPFAMAVDTEDNAYWMNSAGEMIRYDGSSQTTIATGVGTKAVAVDTQGRVYWFSDNDQTLVRLDGGTQTVLASGFDYLQYTFAFAVRG